MFGASPVPRRDGVRRRFAGKIVGRRLHKRQDNGENDQGLDEDSDDDTPTTPSAPPSPGPPRGPPAQFPGRLGPPPFLPPAFSSASSSPSQAPTSEPISSTSGVAAPITAPSESESVTPTQTSSTTSTGSSSVDSTSPSPTPGSPGQGVPLRFPSTFSTATRSATETAIPTEDSALVVPTDSINGQETASIGSGGPQAGAKAGIAVGSIAAAALLVSLLFFLWRRSHARKSRRSAISGPIPVSGSPPQVKDGRTDAEILNDLMASAHAIQNGGLIPDGYVTAGDKKTNSMALPQAEVRSSIASWLRRHHPLQLNPVSDRSSVRSVSRCGTITPSSNPTTPRGPLTPRKSPASPASPSRPQLSPLSPHSPQSPGHHGETTLQPVRPGENTGSTPESDENPSAGNHGGPRNLTPSGHHRAFPLA